MKSCSICGVDFTPRNICQITCSPACSKRRAANTTNAYKRRQYAQRGAIVSLAWDSTSVKIVTPTGDKLVEWAIPSDDMQVPVLWHEVMKYIKQHKLRMQEE